MKQYRFKILPRRQAGNRWNTNCWQKNQCPCGLRRSGAAVTPWGEIRMSEGYFYSSPVDAGTIESLLSDGSGMNGRDLEDVSTKAY
ncbi:MAG: hypothetical protein GY794_17320 [bacterium]|nr:hypothetical protein [bacterium]